MTDLPEQYVAYPHQPNGTGVLVLSGSSGRVERDRADRYASLGARALTYRWFGTEGGHSGINSSGINELPLESLAAALDVLERDCDRLVLSGVSKSAEAFLLLAARDPRVDAVAAFAPTAHVWANIGPDAAGNLRPQRSSWTWQGQPLPFVPYDDDVVVHGDPPAYAPLYTASLAGLHRKDPARAAASSIEVEQIFGEVLLVAGGEDQVWPSVEAARDIERRRAAVDLPTTVVTNPHAGHRTILPCEAVATGGAAMARGGSESADRALGELAWPHLRRLLGPES